MSKRRTRSQTNAQQRPCFADLPDAWCQLLVEHLSTASRLALRSTCLKFLHTCDLYTSMSSQGQPGQQRAQQQQQQQGYSGQLVLRMSGRQPSLHSLHTLGLLQQVVVLDTSSAKRGVLSVGTKDLSTLSCALPRLRKVILNSSQTSLGELLPIAAPKLHHVRLTLCSNSATVMSKLPALSNLAQLELVLQHAAWAKSCSGLGQLQQLRGLSILGKPLEEAAKHGAGSVSTSFWQECIAPLSNLTQLSVTPWVKAAADTDGHISFTQLSQLRSLSVPYCSGKALPGATASLITQVGGGTCCHLTRLCLGMHEFNWDVSGLSGLADQLVELELHNPFLKEIWGLQSFSASQLAPLTAATALTSLILSTMRLPSLVEIMTAAGQPPPSWRPGMTAAVAALMAAGGPVADIVMGAAVGAVANQLLLRSGNTAASAAAAAAAAAGGRPAAAAGREPHSAALLAMAKALCEDTKLAMASAAVRLAKAQLKTALGPGSNASQQQQQQRQLELEAAEAAAMAAVAASDSSSELQELVQFPMEMLTAARQTILTLAVAVAPAAAVVVAGAGAPVPAAFATSFLTGAGMGAPPPPPAVPFPAPAAAAAPADAAAGAVAAPPAAAAPPPAGAAAAPAAAAPPPAAAAAAGLPGGNAGQMAAALGSMGGFIQMFMPGLLHGAVGAGVMPGPAAVLAAVAAAAAAAGAGGGMAGPMDAVAAAAAAAAGAPGQQPGVPVPAVPPPLLPPAAAAAAGEDVAPAVNAAAAAVPPLLVPPPPGMLMPPPGLVPGPAPGGLHVTGTWVSMGLLPLLVPPAALGQLAAAAAAAAAEVLLPQVPWLPQLKRLTVGTLHGSLRGAVGLAALAPNLTCFEDLSEVQRLPAGGDMLAGLCSLQQLTANVDTLQAHARHASLTGLQPLRRQPCSCCGADRGAAPAPPAAAAAAAADGDGGSNGSSQQQQPDKQKPKKRKAAAATAGAGVSERRTRAQRAAARAALRDEQHQQPQQQQHQEQLLPEQGSSSSLTPLLLPSAALAAVAAAAAAVRVRSREALARQRLLSGWRAADWVLLPRLRSLRLLMLGNLHAEVIPFGCALPAVPGITRLELCSAFAGRPEYADTYTTTEDPLLWQQQTSVRELVVDGGVLLGGFLVEARMAALLKFKLGGLQRLIIRRCPDLTNEHVAWAVGARLAREIIVVSDCPKVTESAVQALGAAALGVDVKLVAPSPGEYADASLSSSLEDLVLAG